MCIKLTQNKSYYINNDNCTPNCMLSMCVHSWEYVSHMALCPRLLHWCISSSIVDIKNILQFFLSPRYSVSNTLRSQGDGGLFEVLSVCKSTKQLNFAVFMMHQRFGMI